MQLAGLLVDLDADPVAAHLVIFDDLLAELANLFHEFRRQVLCTDSQRRYRIRTDQEHAEARLVDISIGGVSLDYVKGERPVKKIFALDLQAKDGFRLGKVLLEKVSEKKIRNEQTPYSHHLRGRFLNLSRVKANKLDTFLANYQERLRQPTD